MGSLTAPLAQTRHHDIPYWGSQALNPVPVSVKEDTCVFSGWWFQPLRKILANWDDYSQYMEKCSKPPTSFELIQNVFVFALLEMEYPMVSMAFNTPMTRMIWR